MNDRKRLFITLGAVGLFMVLIAAVVFIRLQGWISGQMALLMLVALLGMYVGFGILIAMYRFVVRMEDQPIHRRARPPEEGS